MGKTFSVHQKKWIVIAPASVAAVTYVVANDIKHF